MSTAVCVASATYTVADMQLIYALEHLYQHTYRTVYDGTIGMLVQML